MHSQSSLSRQRLLAALATIAALAVFFFSATATFAASPQMSATGAFAAAQKGEIVLIDIRTPGEWEQSGIGKGAIPLDMRGADFVETVVKIHRSNPGRPVALICATGGRSGVVTRMLERQGVTGVIDIAEGMYGSAAGRGWLKEGLPVYRGTGAEYESLVKAVTGTL